MMIFRGEVYEHCNNVDFKTPSKPFELEVRGFVVFMGQP